MGVIYPGQSGAPDSGSARITTQGPVPTHGPGGQGNIVQSSNASVGDAMAVKSLPAHIRMAQNATVKGYIHIPYDCRLRALLITSEVTTTAANTIGILVQDTTPASAVDLFTDGVAATPFTFDDAPVLTADKTTVVSTGTPAVGVAALTAANIERLRKDHVLTIAVTAANQAALDTKNLVVTAIIEPMIVDTTVTTQEERVYQGATRGVDA